jgi:hypothetical protein
LTQRLPGKIAGGRLDDTASARVHAEKLLAALNELLNPANMASQLVMHGEVRLLATNGGHGHFLLGFLDCPDREWSPGQWRQ